MFHLPSQSAEIELAPASLKAQQVKEKFGRDNHHILAAIFCSSSPTALA
jgi:hypothetical protein